MKTMKLNPISRQLTARRFWWTAPLFAPGFALANPTGADVVSGQVGISNPDANTLLIDQTSNSAAINWQSFSIDSAEYVIFNQVSSSAVVLNRVVGGNPSEIFGHLLANGRVFLINPNGVLFAPGSQVDVGGLMASTLDISPEDFAAGNYTFAGASTADVTNAGTITAGPNGFVVLAGDSVLNSGLIQGHLGEVLLASGSAVTLTLADSGLVSYAIDAAALSSESGVSNVGQIIADGGLVVMAASTAQSLARTVVNNEGLVRANSIAEGANGEIILTADGGDILNAGTLDASGKNGMNGGTVSVVGNRATRLTSTSVIKAAGDGPTALGGSVHVSGKTVSVRGALGAGLGGTFLLDPADIFIANGTGTASSASSVRTIYEQFIENQLQGGTNVLLVATNSITLDDLGDNVLNGVGVGPASAYGSLTLGIGGSSSSSFFRGPGNPGGGIRFLGSNDAIIVGRTLKLSGGFSYGDIDVGALTAGSDIVIEAAENITTGALTAGGDGGISRVNVHSTRGDIQINGDITVIGTGNGFFGSYGSENLQPPAAGLMIAADRGDVRIGSSGAGGTADISVTATNGPAHVKLRAGSPFGSSSGDLSVFGAITVEGGGGTGTDFFEPSFARAVELRLEAFGGGSGGNILVQDAVTLTANAVDAFGASSSDGSYADVHLHGAAATMHARGTHSVVIGSIDLTAVGEGKVDLAAGQLVQVGAVNINVAEGYGHATITSPNGSSFLSNRADDGDARGGNAEFNVIGNSVSYGSISADVVLGPVSITGPIAEMRVHGRNVTINSSGAGAINLRATGQDVRFRGSNFSDGEYDDIEFGEADALVNGFGNVQINGGVSVVGENESPARLRINAQGAGNVVIGGDVDVSGYGQGFFGKPTFRADGGYGSPSFGAAVVEIYTQAGDIQIGGVESGANVTATAVNGLALVELEAGGASQFGNVAVYGGITVSGGGGAGSAAVSSSDSLGNLPTVAEAYLSALTNGSQGGAVYVRDAITVNGAAVDFQSTYSNPNFDGYGGGSFGTFTANGAQVELTVDAGRRADLGAVDMSVQGDAHADIFASESVLVRGQVQVNVDAVTGATLDTDFTFHGSYGSPVFFGQRHISGNFGSADVRIQGGNVNSQVDLGRVTVSAPSAHVQVAGGHVGLHDSESALAVTADGTWALTSSGSNSGSEFGSRPARGDVPAFGSAYVDITAFGSSGGVFSAGSLDVHGLSNASASLNIHGNGGVLVRGDIAVSGFGQDSSGGSRTLVQEIQFQEEFPPQPIGPPPAARLSITTSAGDIVIGSAGSGGTANVTVTGVNGPATAYLRASRGSFSGYGDIVLHGSLAVSGEGQPFGSSFQPVASAYLEANSSSGYGGNVTVTGAISVTGTPYVESSSGASSSVSYGGTRYFSSFDRFTSRNGGARLEVVADGAANLNSITLDATGDGRVIVVGGGGVTITGQTNVTVDAAYSQNSNSLSGSSYGGVVSFRHEHRSNRQGNAEVRIVGGSSSFSFDPATTVDIGRVTVTGPDASVTIGGGRIILGSGFVGDHAVSVSATGTGYTSNSSSQFGDGFDYTGELAGQAHLDIVALGGSGAESAAVVSAGDLRVDATTPNANGNLDVDGHGSVIINGSISLEDSGSAETFAKVTSQAGGISISGDILVKNHGNDATLFMEGYGDVSVGGQVNVIGDYGNAFATVRSNLGSVSIGSVSSGGVTIIGGSGSAGASFSAYGDLTLHGDMLVNGDRYAGSVDFSAGGSISAQDVVVESRSGSAGAVFNAGGDVQAGDLSASAGSGGGFISVTAGGGIDVGNIDVDGSSLAEVDLSAGGSISVGDINASANSGTAVVHVIATGDIGIGNVFVDGKYQAHAYLSATGGITTGSMSMDGGKYASAQVTASGDINTGAITVTGKYDAALDVYADGDIATSGITVSGQNGASANFHTSNGNLSVGDVDVQSSYGSAYLSLGAGGGAISGGDVDVYSNVSQGYLGVCACDGISIGNVAVYGGGQGGVTLSTVLGDLTVAGGLVVEGGSFANATLYAGGTVAVTGAGSDEVRLQNANIRAGTAVSFVTSGDGDITLDNAYIGGNGPDVRPNITISAGGNLSLPSFGAYGGVVHLAAGGVVDDYGGDGGFIDADALGVAAGESISLALTSFDVGYGDAPFGADARVAKFMRQAGLAPPSSVVPNVAFAAPTVSIRAGNLHMDGDHLFLRADVLDLGGSQGGQVSAPQNILVHYRPHTDGAPIYVFADSASELALREGGLSLGDLQHFQRFPGTTHFFGGDGYSGAIEVSPDGTPIVHEGSTNFVFLTRGRLSGQDTIETNGTVFPLFDMTDYQPVASEYDPSAGERRRKSGGGEGADVYLERVEAGEVQQETNADVTGECKS